MHSFRSLTEVTEKLKQFSSNFPGGGTFEQLLGQVRSEFEHNFSKNSNAQGVAGGGDVEASIWLVH